MCPSDLANIEYDQSIEAAKLPAYLQDTWCSIGGDDSHGPSSTHCFTFRRLGQINHSLYGEQLFQLLLHRESLTQRIAQHGRCYPPQIVQRALIYEALCYDDLAAFDAYVVYTLCDKELSDEFVTDLEAEDKEGGPWLQDEDETSRQAHIEAMKQLAAGIVHRCLTRTGATSELDLFVMADSNGTNLEHSLSVWEIEFPARLQMSDGTPDSYSVNTPDVNKKSLIGYARREIYPWSTFEPLRNSPETVVEINDYLATFSHTLEAKVTELPAFDEQGKATGGISSQLGLFAKQDLAPGEEVLREKSILTAIRPLEDAICDACGQELEEIPFEDIRQCDGDDCDITFCSQECKDRAYAEYHKPSLTEDPDDATDDDTGETSADENEPTQPSPQSGSLSNASQTISSSSPFCSNPDLATIGRPTTTSTSEWDLYFLLLTRTIAMSHTQTTHPLALKEIKHLWADFQPSPFSPSSPPSSKNTNTYTRTLPLTLHHTLSLPLDFFTTLSQTSPHFTPYSAHWLAHYDFWILQQLAAKFRGVANATQSTFDGKPEIASVHAGWCLANHSCEPNVRWTPKGVRRFYVRTSEERVWDANLQRQEEEEEGGGSGGEEKGKEWAGIKAGEEIFSHYTDVRLPVGERRERLREVLGGLCQCARCKREAGEE